MRVILLGFGERADVVAEAQRQRPIIEQEATIVATDFTGKEDMSEAEADLSIVFGGDGSILRAAHQMGSQQLPVIAVNLGKLGFLADLSPPELPTVLHDFHAGSASPIWAHGHLQHVYAFCRCQSSGSIFLPVEAVFSY